MEGPNQTAIVRKSVISKSERAADHQNSDLDFASELLESDRRYFECGAQLLELSGARVAYLPQLASVTCGCVIHRVDEHTDQQKSPRQWIENVEQTVRQIGGSQPRFYLTRPMPPLESELACLGYQKRVEIGYLNSGLRAATAEPPIELRPIESDGDWQSKLELHGQDQLGPDGHRVSAQLWVEVERRKVEAGFMTAFLAIRHGRVCGAVSLARKGNFLRLKNLFVQPRCRRKSVASDIVHSVFAMATKMQVTAVGCFAVVGDLGQRVYESCGMRAVTRQTEWICTSAQWMARQATQSAKTRNVA